MCRYAVTRFYLGKVGEAHRVRELAQLSVSLAHTAASTASRGTLIAASVPPLGESYALRTASELSEMRDEWREIVGGLLAPPGAHATRPPTLTEHQQYCLCLHTDQYLIALTCVSTRM